MGVVAIQFNLLETILLGFHHLYLRRGKEVSFIIFDASTNTTRCELLGKLADTSERHSEVTELVHWFIKGFYICAENRNTLMHSAPLGKNEAAEGLRMGKRPRKSTTKFNEYLFALDDIRGVADSIDEFALFGRRVMMNVSFHECPAPGIYFEPLPDKPSLPRKLMAR